MALAKWKLQDPLKDLFEGTNGFPSSRAKAAEAFASIYRSYAADAAAATTRPVSALLATAASTLASALDAAFKAAEGAGAAGVAALGVAMDKAFVEFWMKPQPMKFAFPVTGIPTIGGIVTVAPPGVPSLGLTALFLTGAAGGPTAAQQAQAMANILDTWTRTVTVVNTSITPPGPATPPIPLV
jgi:hypothetical protein